LHSQKYILYSITESRSVISDNPEFLRK